MNTDTKWEPVEYRDLNVGDSVRLVHDNGDIVHGHVVNHKDTISLSIFEGIIVAARVTERGYSFERAVPERTATDEGELYVPFAEVEELRKRIQTARSSVVGKRWPTEHDIKRLVAILDGEA